MGRLGRHLAIQLLLLPKQSLLPLYLPACQLTMPQCAQQEAYGRTVPDSFTHGTSEQRKKWFNRGYTYGDLAHADTFSVENP